MPRLLDDIRSLKRLEKPWFIPPSKEDLWIEHSRRLWPMLSEDHSLPVLLIDNVAEYYYTATGQENWAIDKDFPNLAPPFPAFWVEHRIPRVIHSDQLGDTDITKLLPQGGRVGVLVYAVAPQDCVAEGIPEEARWILWFELFVDYRLPGRGPEGPHGMIFLCVDPEGRALEVPWMQSFAGPEHGEVLKSFMTWLNPILLAISFLHCRNVELINNRISKPLAKKWHEKTGNWPTPYKTLIIEPLKKILRHEGGADRHGIQRAMHICRGHFKDYREGRGLFGKYHQLVWQPALVRGTRHKDEKAPGREIELRLPAQLPATKVP